MELNALPISVPPWRTMRIFFNFTLFAKSRYFISANHISTKPIQTLTKKRKRMQSVFPKFSKRCSMKSYTIEDSDLCFALQDDLLKFHFFNMYVGSVISTLQFKKSWNKIRALASRDFQYKQHCNITFSVKILRT